MEGLFPIGDGFQAPGYVPIGSITYKVHSPRQDKLGSGSSAKGRRLFSEYTGVVGSGLPDPTNAVGSQDPGWLNAAQVQGVCITLVMFAGWC